MKKIQVEGCIMYMLDNRDIIFNHEVIGRVNVDNHFITYGLDCCIRLPVLKALVELLESI